jgi:4-diphosphocytidyl-2-C-methyl-D-erythritol kinase
MITFPNCKLNLGLNIIRKRTDGFHDLETVFYPIQIKDALEIIKSETETNIQFSSSGLIIDGNSTDNICFKAYHLLKKDFPSLPSIQMHLHKAIPMGAGLGGGSSDGAFALKMLNEKFQLGISQEQLISYALKLGSDCPFFIINKPCFATSRGEIMSGLNLDLSTYQFLVVNPHIHINTGWAFQQILPCVPVKSVQEIVLQPIESWKEELINDFELPVITAYPEIGAVKNVLYNNGAIYASMSGSGSTLFGIFDKNQTIHFEFPENYLIIRP